MDDQVAHVKQFQMGNGVIDRISDGATRFRQCQRNLANVPAHGQYGRDEDKTNRRVGRGRRKNERAEQ